MIRATQARIDVDALRSNIRTIRSLVARESSIMAVVKADCYGHGVDICMPVMRAEGIDVFGVATVEEGMQLRSIGVEDRVVVLPPPPFGQAEAYVRNDLEATLSDERSAEELSAIAAAGGRSVRVHVHIDTGMTRNGLAPEDALEFIDHIRAMPSLDIVGLATHFATSDEPDVSFARAQLARFDDTVARLRDAGHTFRDVHVSNSGGIFRLADAHYTMVRPGIALYGYHPWRDAQASSGLVPVMSLHSAVGGVRCVDADVPVGYGRTWRTTRRTMIATIPVGYADGLFRTLSNRFDVLINGTRYQSVGTVSMDEVMIDLGMSSNVKRGDAVVIIGNSGSESITAWDTAATAGTIPYEICTNISARVPRRAVASSTHSSTQ